MRDDLLHRLDVDFNLGFLLLQDRVDWLNFVFEQVLLHRQIHALKVTVSFVHLDFVNQEHRFFLALSNHFVWLLPQQIDVSSLTSHDLLFGLTDSILLWDLKRELVNVLHSLLLTKILLGLLLFFLHRCWHEVIGVRRQVFLVDKLETVFAF